MCKLVRQAARTLMLAIEWEDVSSCTGFERLWDADIKEATFLGNDSLVAVGAHSSNTLFLYRDMRGQQWICACKQVGLPACCTTSVSAKSSSIALQGDCKTDTCGMVYEKQEVMGCAGSDDGHVWIYATETGRPLVALAADQDVVNAVQVRHGAAPGHCC